MDLTAAFPMKAVYLRKFLFCRLAALLMLLLPVCSDATEGGTEKAIDASLRKELTYLLSFVGSDAAGGETFQGDRISALMRFVTGPKQPQVRYHAGTFNSAPSAYLEFDIHRSLSQILQLAYNPDIPSVVTMPASIRLSHWTDIDTPKHALPDLWETLPVMKAPHFITGIEHIVNSPDQHSGAYFEYDLYRTLILTKHEGRPVLISLSRQKDVSDVGKKGLIIGADDNWDYIYTGQAGVSYAGLGWVKSYMYDSYSVSFYIETDAAPPTVRFGVFKWLRAGWAGINLARSAHIYRGLERFAKSFKSVLESPRLDDVTAVSRDFANIKRLSIEEQRKIIEGYLTEIEKKCRLERRFSDEQLNDLFKDRHYLNSLTKEERQSLIALALVKNLLGNAPTRELTYLQSKPDAAK
ncbi:MAG: hypothetical protein P8Y74_10135 [Desulfobacterales bacterium]|jgi:hypothetical protein